MPVRSPAAAAHRARRRSAWRRPATPWQATRPRRSQRAATASRADRRRGQPAGRSERRGWRSQARRAVRTAPGRSPGLH
eukprot:scaffold33632_cov135-Isochrysis_galbana.AAC.3